MSEIVRFDEVSLYYPGAGTRIHRLSFTLEKGQNLVILGPEGAGKNMVLDILIGKAFPDSGEVYVDGKKLTRMEGRDLAEYRKKLGYLSYNFGLINNLSVQENILLPLRYHTNYNEETLQEIAIDFLARYHLIVKRNMRPQFLTYNEALRLIFIRALIRNPDLILMDNALGGQCPLGLAKFMELAEGDIEKHHGSFILASFDPGQFYRYADRFMLLYNGEIVFDGTPEELKTTDNPFVRQYLYHPLEGPMKHFFEPIRSMTT